MIAYYELTKSIYDHLIADEDLNTVVIGNPDLIDTNKHSLFPLAHLLIGTATPRGSVIDFSVTVTCMDIIDIEKDNPTFSWKGEDNKQYILNTMLAVLENLDKNLTQGAMQESGWELLADPVATPFEDQYENFLTGWSMTFNVSIPNTVQNCSSEYDVKFVSANGEYISSPDQQYLPDTIAELDIELDIVETNATAGNLISQGFASVGDNRLLIGSGVSPKRITLSLRTNGSNQTLIQSSEISSFTGNVKIKGNGSNVEIYWNGVLVADELITIDQDLASISDELYFAATDLNGSFILPSGNVQMSMVKINNHVWTFDEGSGATTTNSEGVISTLNSDISVNNMWVRV